MFMNMKRGFLAKPKMCMLAGVTAVAVTAFAGTQPAKADLASAMADIDTAMTALSGIAETGVAIVVVPFGLGFALKIAGHILRAGT